MSLINSQKFYLFIYDVQNKIINITRSAVENGGNTYNVDAHNVL